MQSHEVARLLRNWREECDSAALYDTLAALERNVRLKRVFRKLADSEREHSAYWEGQLRSRGATVPHFRPSLGTRLMMRLARRFGVAFVLPSITSRELADQDRYASQEDASAAGLSREERGHAAVMRRVTAHSEPAERDTLGAASGGSLSNNLRAAVLGANDGLVSNFCLLMGVVGGGASAAAVLLTGVAGLVAGACSMALGEWLSVTNALEMARSQMDVDTNELHASRGWKHTELMLIYQADGMAEDEASRAADRILARDLDAINALIREEQVMAAAQLGNNPVSAAAYSFGLFAAGALVPLLPFLLLRGVSAITASVASSLLALLVLGFLTSFFNGRSLLFSGSRQLLVGAAAAAITYGAGRLVGVFFG